MWLSENTPHRKLSFREELFSAAGGTRERRGRGGYEAPTPRPLGSRQFFLRALPAFLDLHYLVGDVAVRFTVDGFCRFSVWGFSKAEDLATLLVVPVPVILDPVLVLDFKVLLVDLGHCFGRKPF
jgi:hypothetical protein